MWNDYRKKGSFNVGLIFDRDCQPSNDARHQNHEQYEKRRS
jgi:hypothetical protein